MKNLKSVRIEFHILQSFPVTCLNRDDVGSPKTARIGGVTRARVSSQCWKREVRSQLKNLGVRIGIRTKYISQMIQEKCLSMGVTQDQAEKCGNIIAQSLAKDTLYFFSEKEIQAYSDFLQNLGVDAFLKLESKKQTNEVHKIGKKILDDGLDALDIALFGRMVAQAAELSVEAASCFAHAISTHAISNEIDFFTALDDYEKKTIAGSAHMGTLEFNSATYYRYVSLNLGQLSQSLPEEKDLLLAVQSFLKALYLAIPQARQTTQAGFCPWDFARVYIRQGQGLQLSFEEPVKTKGGGYLRESISTLQKNLEEKEKTAGSLFGKLACFELGGDNKSYSIDDLISDVQKSIEKL
jgi:CRISPR system Cascade subunit CasC